MNPPAPLLCSNGTLIEYIGDAILAVWNAPIEIEDHACLAVCSTLLMQDRLRWLRKEWSDTVYRHARLNGKHVPDCQVRCGLHTASCFVGNVGSSTRMKYGVIGGRCRAMLCSIRCGLRLFSSSSK